MADPIPKTASLAELVPAADDAGSTRPAPTAPPSGRYALGDEIARGGMGVVHRAVDTALGREVAVKVLHARFGPSSGAARRFADEARITARLQHPNIPAVHDLGALPDGRPFLAMKLIQGDTLDELVKARPDPAHDRGRFVAVFEQIGQAVAYAHSCGVIHRDLKPANVMVGAFGEVQVMDWGLAKAADDRRDAGGAGDDLPAKAGTAADTPAAGGATRAGVVVGTPGYLSPEQAAGAVDRLDARTDVFGLGSILCVLLTGSPPHCGATPDMNVALAAVGRTDECFARLDASGADPELVALCKLCLATRPEDRPADGGAVAREVAALRQAADERARRAELDRAASEGRAREHAKRRRAQLGLALAVLLLAVGAGGAVVWRAAEERSRRERAADAVAGLLDQVERWLEEGEADRAAPLLTEAEGRASDAAGAHAERLTRARDGLAVLRELDAVDDFGWTPVGSSLPPPDVLVSRWAGVFERFGVVPGRIPPPDAAAAIRASPVRTALVAALDGWLVRTGSEPVRAILEAADPDAFRSDVRRLLVTSDQVRLDGLADRPEWDAQPAGLVAAYTAGRPRTDASRRLLTRVVTARPVLFPLLMQLGGTCPPDEAARWYQAAVALRPTNAGTHHNLGTVLHRQGDLDGAMACYREAIRLNPNYSPAHSNLGNLLRARKYHDLAIASYQEALRIDPKNASAHNNLGLALMDKGDTGEAIVCFRTALRLGLTEAGTHVSLGNALYVEGSVDDAVACYREAIHLDPNSWLPHYNLGHILSDKGEFDRAIACYREAIRLDPKRAAARYSLGNALRDKGDLDGAMACYREAIRLDPKDSFAHNNLGTVLHRQGDLDGAMACYREAIRLDPRNSFAQNNLGNALRDKGDLDGAIACYQEAVRVDPRNGQAASSLARVQTMRKRRARLADVLAGRDRPASPSEGCQFAELCTQSFERRFAAAVRFFEEAFTQEPALADDRAAAHRYNAACVAALAARGAGMDAPADHAERASLRAKAMDWLRADLAVLRAGAGSPNAAGRKTAADTLDHWLKDADLAGVRPGLWRISMPAAERAGWDAFWADVRAVISEARKPLSPPETAPPPRADK